MEKLYIRSLKTILSLPNNIKSDDVKNLLQIQNLEEKINNKVNNFNKKEQQKKNRQFINELNQDFQTFFIKVQCKNTSIHGW